MKCSWWRRALRCALRNIYGVACCVWITVSTVGMSHATARVQPVLTGPSVGQSWLTPPGTAQFLGASPGPLAAPWLSWTPDFTDAPGAFFRATSASPVSTPILLNDQSEHAYRDTVDAPAHLSASDPPSIGDASPPEAPPSLDLTVLSSDPPVLVQDVQTGIEGTNAPDVITINNLSEVIGQAEAQGNDVSLSLTGAAGADVSVTAEAYANALDALAGADLILVNEPLNASAFSEAITDGLTLNLTEFASADGSVTASSNVTTLLAGEGDDTITVASGAEIESYADAESFSRAVFDVTLLDVTGGQVDTTVSAIARSAAADLGPGGDTLTNFGDIIAGASSNVIGGSTSFGIIGNPSIETSTLSLAQAVGVLGGAGDDVVLNHSLIDVNTLARIDFFGMDIAFVGTDISSIDAPVISTSWASGIAGDAGNDTIINHDFVGAIAQAETGFGSGTLSAIMIDNPLAKAVVDTSPAAIAIATGVSGDGGDDRLENHGNIHTESQTFGNSQESEGSILGLVNATAATRSDATATGVDGGAGDDTILNTDLIETIADADGFAAGVSYALSVVPIPTGGIFPFANAEAVSTARATGISGGEGNDQIANAGLINATATANMTSLEVTAKVGFSGVSGGGGGGGSVAADVGGDDGGAGAGSGADETPPMEPGLQSVDTSTERSASAFGIAGGDGDDAITNDGFIDADADATAIGVNVNVGIAVPVTSSDAVPDGLTAGADAGDAAGDDGAQADDVEALAFTIVHSNAVAIDAGAGDDVIQNRDMVYATATSLSLEVAAKGNLTIPVNPLGALGPGIGVDASGMTESVAAGIAGGAGDDSIFNNGTIAVLAESVTLAYAAEVNSQVTIPAVIPDLFTSNVTSTTSARAYGLFGDDLADPFSTGNDEIYNTGAIGATASALSSGETVAYSLSGALIGDVSTSSNAFADGINSSFGDDLIYNSGLVSADATAWSLGVAVEGLPAGATVGIANNTASATALGVHGASDDDVVINLGTIDATADATATSVLIDVSLLGAAVSVATTTSDALSVGLGGGTGEDTIASYGPISAAATATTHAALIDIGGLAAPGASVSVTTGTEATSTAYGILAGPDDDAVMWTDTVTANATADSGAATVDFSAIGAAVGVAGVSSTATAVGVDAEGGDDTLAAIGQVDAHATATNSATNVQINGTGASVGVATTEVSSRAVGIDAGEGDDSVMIEEAVTATADAESSANGVSVNLVGAGVQDAGVTIHADAIGVDAGDDNDNVINYSDVTATANATGHAGNVSVNALLGAGVSNASLNGTAAATGITGGAGDDMLLNLGLVSATSSAMADVTSFSFSFAGAAVAAAGGQDAMATSSAQGMTGSDGSDWIRNENEVVADASALFTVKVNSALNIVGFAGASTQLGATVNSIAIDGGAGDDLIENLASLTALADATVERLAGASFTVAGATSQGTKLSSSAHATGIAGGAGADTISNADFLLASANAESSEQTSSLTILGSASSDSVVSTHSLSVGIDAGDGDNDVSNTGLLIATSSADIFSDGGSFTFAGASGAEALISSDAMAMGIMSGFGESSIMNAAGAVVDVTAESKATLIGSASNIFGPPSAAGTANSTASAAGIRIDSGPADIANAGAVLSAAIAETTVNADADTVVGGPNAQATALDTSADAVGVMLVASDNSVHNLTGGIIEVNAIATSNATANASTIVQQAEAFADAGALATATGLRVADGANAVLNDGTLRVTANSSATATTTSESSFSVDFNCYFTGDPAVIPVCEAIFTFGDATSDSAADAFSTAIGIDGGSGPSTILNTGLIDVNATAFAAALADAQALLDDTVSVTFAGIEFTFDVPFVDVTETAQQAANSTAIGILTGPSDDLVVNSGDVSADASNTGAGGALYAAAISTGDGADTVINQGSGSLAASLDGADGTGIAIDTGAGDDTVRLLGDSAALGDIFLADGNDLIALADAPWITGTIHGGAGLDTIRIEDRSTHSLAANDLNSVERHEVDQGRLEIDGDYDILPGGALEVEIYKQGNGQLQIMGDSAIGTDSNLKVIAGRRLYFDGDTFDVMLADSISNTFATEDLTQTAFLALQVNYLPETVQVELAVQPFLSLATNTVHRAVATYIDLLAPTVTGGLEDIFAEIQQLTDPEDIYTAYCSLSPDSYDASTKVVLANMQNHNHVLHQRARTFRAFPSAGSTETVSGTIPVSGSYLGMGSSQPSAPGRTDSSPFGFWASGLGQFGDQGGRDGYAGFDYVAGGAIVGLDSLFNEHFFAGASFAYTRSSLDLDQSLGSGDIDSLTASIYGGWFTDNAYINAAISYGFQSFDNRRRVTVGMIDYTASSDHTGNLLAASIEGGPRFHLGDEWDLEPYAGVHFTYLDEGGFRESGADGANLVVGSRSTESLLSELGLRATAHIRREEYVISPSVALAWMHDFQIDDHSITAGFAGAPGTSFTLAGLDAAQDRARIDAGVGVRRGNVSASLQYFGELGDDYQAHGIMASIGFSF